MSKVAHYLQEHLLGEVTAANDMRRYFATDSSVFSVTPSLVVYPRNEQDVRKTARFTWQLAERGRVIPITARGLGSDLTGAAIGEGIVVVFPAHMNRILELDGKTGDVIVEPGINYGKLQQTLHTHGRFLPPFPASLEYSTVGGAIGNNAAGEKSVKYGDTRQYVKSLRVVLANGEVIEAKRLSKREVSKKMGQSSFEGEVYRALDALFEENKQLVDNMQFDTTRNASGYSLGDVKRKDGSIDLTPLLVGSQGTLGVVTEATLSTQPHNTQTTLITAFFDSIQEAEDVILQLRKLPDLPSACELIDGSLLEFLSERNPNLLKGVVEKPFSKLVLLTEFDNANARIQKKLAKKTEKLLKQRKINYKLASSEEEKEQMWKIRHSSAAVVTHAEGSAKALPIIDDGIVPVAQFKNYLSAIYGLFEKYNLPVAVWGHAADANLHVQPVLDLGQVGDRQKVFKLMEEYYSLVIGLGGNISGAYNDGRLRAPFVLRQYGDDVYKLFQKVKQIFDPYGTLNPGVKMNVGLENIKPLLRHTYSLDHLASHLPRS